MAAPTIPQAVRAMMAQRDHRMHHFLWHEVRNGWNFYDGHTRTAIRALGWEPPRPSLAPAAISGGRPILDNDSGEDFLYMHRQMIVAVNQKLVDIADPLYPKVQGWVAVPPPADPDYPVPPPWNSGSPARDATIANAKSDDLFTQRMQPWDAHYRDVTWLSGRTLGELGARIEFTIHNLMHLRWSSDPGPTRPDADPSHPDDIDPRWDDPQYDWLGDTYASHVNSVFWKVHGWVDDRIEDWKRANGVTGDVAWKGTWVGKMPPHPAPHSLHALLGGQHETHDHGSETKKLLSLVLRSGIRCRFYDRFDVPE